MASARRAGEAAAVFFARSTIGAPPFAGWGPLCLLPPSHAPWKHTPPRIVWDVLYGAGAECMRPLRVLSWSASRTSLDGGRRRRCVVDPLFPRPRPRSRLAHPSPSIITGLPHQARHRHEGHRPDRLPGAGTKKRMKEGTGRRAARAGCCSCDGLGRRRSSLAPGTGARDLATPWLAMNAAGVRMWACHGLAARRTPLRALSFRSAPPHFSQPSTPLFSAPSAPYPSIHRSPRSASSSWTTRTG